MVKPSFRGRDILLYTSRPEEKQRWQAMAEKTGISLSEWCREIIEQALTANQEPAGPAQAKELKRLREEAEHLREENRLKTTLLERQAADLYKLRYGLFGSPENKATEYDDRLVEVLRSGKVVSSCDLLKELGIDPKDTEAMKLIHAQLSELQQLGVVKETSKGWRWID